MGLSILHTSAQKVGLNMVPHIGEIFYENIEGVHFSGL